MSVGVMKSISESCHVPAVVTILPKIQITAQKVHQHCTKFTAFLQKETLVQAGAWCGRQRAGKGTGGVGFLVLFELQWQGRCLPATQR